MDLYALVKKKTTEETLLIMILPGSVIATATMMLPICLEIPADACLESAWTKVVSPGLWAELLCLAASQGYHPPQQPPRQQNPASVRRIPTRPSPWHSGTGLHIAESLPRDVCPPHKENGNPLADDMARFAQWGDRKEGLDRFCREYFLEEPVLKTKDFILTRHYLADERGMLEVFALDALEKIDGNWVSDPKKGWVRKLSL